MGRLLMALIVGVIINVLVVFGVEWLGALLHPLPPGLDPMDTNQMRDYMASGGVPVTSMLLVLFAYAVGAFGGGFVATKLAPNRGLMPALVIGQISLVLIIINLVQLPHPIWMIVTSLLIPLPSAWYGGKTAHARGGMK